MKDFFVAIIDIIKKAGFSFLLLALTLYFSSDSLSVYFLILFAITQIQLLLNNKKNNNVVVSLVLFSISYCLIWIINGSVNSYAILISILLCPVFFYLYGVKIGQKLDYSRELPIALLLLITVMLLNVFKATVLNVLEVGIIDPTRQLIFEEEENVASATVWGLVVSPALGLLIVPLFVSHPIRKIWPVLSTALATLALLTVVHIVNRGGLAIATVAIFISLFVRFKDKKIYLILAFIFAVIILLYFLPSNGEIYEAYSARSDAEGDIERLYRWLYGLGNLFLHPLGWNDPTLDHQFFMHNLWLDVARVSGIIPFLCLFIATIRTIKNVYKLFRMSNSVTTIILVSIFSTLFMACFMEPALEAKQVAVYFFIFIWGVIAGVLRNKTLYNECNTIK